MTLAAPLTIAALGGERSAPAMAAEFIDWLVTAGGPQTSDYTEFAAALNTVHNQTYHQRDGLSVKVGDSRPLEDALSRHWRIFRTTLSMQGLAWSKPHGYAGDYEIIERIYAKSCSNIADLKRWDDFFHAGAGPNAVRNRARLLADLLAEYNPTRLCSIGCGPCMDIREGILSATQLSKITLVDNDENALTRAKVNLRSLFDIGTAPDIEFVYKNALRYRPEQTFDCVWCSGLFDYLGDRAFVFLAQRLRQMLAPGGVIGLGNFSVENPSRAYMELVGEWFLVHRSKDDLRKLAVAAGFEASKVRVTCDATGLNLFLLAET